MIPLAQPADCMATRVQPLANGTLRSLTRSGHFRDLHHHFQTNTENASPSVPMLNAEEILLIQNAGERPSKKASYINHVALKRVKQNRKEGSEIIPATGNKENPAIRPYNSDSFIGQRKINPSSPSLAAVISPEMRILRFAIQTIIKSLSDPLMNSREDAKLSMVRKSNVEVQETLDASSLALRRARRQSVPALCFPAFYTASGPQRSPRLQSKAVTKRLPEAGARRMSFSQIPSPIALELDSPASGKQVILLSAKNSSEDTQGGKAKTKYLSPRPPSDFQPGSSKLFLQALVEINVRDTIVPPVPPIPLENPYLDELQKMAAVLYEKNSDSQNKRKAKYRLEFKEGRHLYWKHGHPKCTKIALEYVLSLLEKSWEAGHVEFKWRTGFREGEEPQDVCLLDIIDILMEYKNIHQLMEENALLRNRIIHLTHEVLYAKPIRDARWILHLLQDCGIQLTILTKCINQSQQELIEIIKRLHLQKQALSELDNVFLNFIAKILGLSSSFGSCNREEIIKHLSTLFDHPSQILVDDGRCVIAFEELMERIKRSVHQFLEHCQAMKTDLQRFIQDDESVGVKERPRMIESLRQHQYRDCLVMAIRKSNLAYENSNENFINGMKNFAIQAYQALRWNGLLSPSIDTPYRMLLKSLNRPIDWEMLDFNMKTLSAIIQKKMVLSAMPQTKNKK